MLDYCWSLYYVGQKKTGINWLATKALSELGTALPQLVDDFITNLKYACYLACDIGKR